MKKTKFKVKRFSYETIKNINKKFKYGMRNQSEETTEQAPEGDSGASE